MCSPLTWWIKVLHFPLLLPLVVVSAAPDNQGWILLNVARTHREADSKKFLPESEITSKVHLDQQKQQTSAAVAANVTPLSTKSGENTSEVLLQIFDPTEKIILT